MSFAALSLVILFSASCYLYIKYLYSYWERRGVKYVEPSFPFGNLANNFLQKQSIAGLYQTFYNNSEAATEPFIGIFSLFQPVLILRDPELIRKVLIKDFQYFVDRGFYHDHNVDILSANLFAIDGAKWKNVRTKLSPTFTSGKLKAMFSTLLDCNIPIKKYLDTAAKNMELVELRELSACYSTNVIASVAFGIDVDCIAKPDTSFRRYGRKVFGLSFMNNIRLLMSGVCPKIMKLFKMRVYDREVEDFMMEMVKRTLGSREKGNIVRKDFFQLLVQVLASK